MAHKRARLWTGAATVLCLASAVLGSPTQISARPNAPRPDRAALVRGEHCGPARWERLRGGGSGFFACFGAGSGEEEELPRMSAEVPDAPEVAGEGKPRRNTRFPELIGHAFDDKPEIDTPLLGFFTAADRFPNNHCLGRRMPQPDGRGAGPYEWLTYSSVKKGMLSVGEHLMKSCGLARGAKVGIYSMNRPEWTMSALALWSQGLVCVPLYDSVGSDAVRYIVNHASLPLVFVERSKLPTLLDAAKESRSLRYLVLLEDEVTDADRALVKQALGNRDLKLHAWSTFANSEPAGAPQKGATQKAHELAVVLYTSGTTGDPKGVMLSAGNIMASAAGCLRQDASYDGKDTATSVFFNEATYISYLPLAHSFELNMQMLLLMCGGAIGFFQGDARKLVAEDIPALKPTVMAGVPRVYSRIYDKVTAMVESKGLVTRTVFRMGIAATERAMRVGKRSSFWDALLFNKLQKVLGGNVKIFLSGAAPLSSDLHGFLKIAFNAPVVQGYGMTENAGAACTMSPMSTTVGTVGSPICATEIKLVDVPEMEYLHTDTYPASKDDFEKQVTFKGEFRPHLAGRPIPRGEICMRGKNVMMGYLKLEAETAAVLAADGWLRTGDVGQWNLDGSLTIVDRKKNIFKLAQGEYIAVESVEGVVAKSKFVMQCWVYGNSFENSLVAVIVPDKDAVMGLCKKKSIEAVDLAAACQDLSVQASILTDVRECCVAAGLRGYEHPKALYLETCDLTDLGQGFTVQVMWRVESVPHWEHTVGGWWRGYPELPAGKLGLPYCLAAALWANDCLTPSMKLRRPQLLRRYSTQVDAMYAQLRAADEAKQK